MRTLPLSKGCVALVDDADYERLAAHKWTTLQSGARRYAVRNEYVPGGKGKAKMLLLHRVVVGLPPGRLPEVDHKDGDGLNNQRANLRVATRSQNNANQRLQSRPKSSRFKGVSWSRDKQLWHAHIKWHGRNMFLGYFQIESEAAAAYDEAAVRIFGEFARPNGNVA